MMWGKAGVIYIGLFIPNGQNYWKLFLHMSVSHSPVHVRCDLNFKCVLLKHSLVVDILNISCEMAFMWMTLDWSDCSLSRHLFQKMTSHSRLCREKGHTWNNVNTLRLRQNGCHFPVDIFKWIFMNENIWISINISLKFVPINNIPTLVHLMAWRRPGDKPLSEPMIVILLTHICVTRPQWVKQFMWCDITSPAARE